MPPMKIILRTDVDSLGRLGEEVAVKPGYARNYLIPQGMAMPATLANMRRFEMEKKKLQAKVDAARAEAQSMADKLAGVKVMLEVRVGEGDKLYGSVTSANIVATLATMGIELDKRKIALDQPIRSLGEYEVEVRLHADVRVALPVVVTKPGHHYEEPAEEAPAAVEAPAESETDAA